MNAMVLVSFITALVAELSGAALGFGPAILYEISWQLCCIFGLTTGTLELAVFHIVLQEAPCSVLQLFVLRRFWRPRLVATLTLPLLATLPLGTALLEHFGHSLLAKQVLGGAFLLLAALYFWKEHWRQVNALEHKPNMEDCHWSVLLGVSLTAALAGLLRGALGLAGPPFMVLLLFFSIDQAVWRCLANVMRFTMILAQGLMLGFDHQMDIADWPIYLALMSGGLLGLLVGNQLAEKIDGAAFHRWLLLFLIAGGLLMLSSGNAVLSECSAGLVVLSAILVLLSVRRGSSSESKLMCNATIELEDKGILSHAEPFCSEGLEVRSQNSRSILNV